MVNFYIAWCQIYIRRYRYEMSLDAFTASTQRNEAMHDFTPSLISWLKSGHVQGKQMTFISFLNCHLTFQFGLLTVQYNLDKRYSTFIVRVPLRCNFSSNLYPPPKVGSPKSNVHTSRSPVTNHKSGFEVSVFTTRYFLSIMHAPQDIFVYPLWYAYHRLKTTGLEDKYKAMFSCNLLFLGNISRYSGWIHEIQRQQKHIPRKQITGELLEYL
jgi:hypothetical protein